MSIGKLLNGASQTVVDLTARREFTDAVAKAERLAREPVARGIRDATPAALAMLERIIDSLEPLQVLGGSLSVGRVDIWFNPRLLLEEMPGIAMDHRAPLMEIFNSVVTEFSPGPELTAALAQPIAAPMIEQLNEIMDRYRKRLIQLGAPTPAALVRKRLGIGP